MLGGMVRHFLREPREIAREQLAVTMPERTPAEREKISEEMFRGLGRSMVEILLMDRIAADLDFWVEGEGLDVMDRALARGRGVIAITGHIGNWELMAAYLGLNNYPLTAIATPVKGVALNHENVELRRRVNVETVQRDGPGAAQAILRTLRAGRILAILMDQDTRGKGVVVPFFGRPAFTPVGPAALAWRTGAAIVGVFIHRGADGRHHLKVVEPKLPERRGEGSDFRADWQYETTAELTRLIELEVRARPDEWVWWHRRWQRGAAAVL
jgi:KDO2-lipid IV(A) lauroyltransferase